MYKSVVLIIDQLQCSEDSVTSIGYYFNQSKQFLKHEIIMWLIINCTKVYDGCSIATPKPPSIIFHFIFSEFSALNISNWDNWNIHLKQSFWLCLVTVSFSGDWNFHSCKLKHSVTQSFETFKNVVYCVMSTICLCFFVCRFNCFLCF